MDMEITDNRSVGLIGGPELVRIVGEVEGAVRLSLAVSAASPTRVSAGSMEEAFVRYLDQKRALPGHRQQADRFVERARAAVAGDAEQRSERFGVSGAADLAAMSHCSVRELLVNAGALGREAADARPGAVPMHGPLVGADGWSRGWRWCRKCETFFKARAEGSTVDLTSAGLCHDGLPHDGTESGRYELPTVAQTGAQAGWRRCRRCESLHFGGAPTPGTCAAGGEHDAAGEEYHVPLIETWEAGQVGWRYCRNCRQLFFSGNATLGRCPAGGEHDPSESGTYAAPMVWPNVARLWLRQIVCMNETDPDNYNDDIALGWVPIDAYATTGESSREWIGEFQGGDHREFADKVLATFDLRSKGASLWPKRVGASLVLCEEDCGGFVEFLNKLRGLVEDTLHDKLKEAAKAAGKALVDLVGLGEVPGPGDAVGSAILAATEWIVSKLWGWIVAWFEDDEFGPCNESINVPGAGAAWWGRTDPMQSSVRTWDILGYGGFYKLSVQWSLAEE